MKDRVSEIRNIMTNKLDLLIAVYKNDWIF